MSNTENQDQTLRLIYNKINPLVLDRLRFPSYYGNLSQSQSDLIWEVFEITESHLSEDVDHSILEKDEVLRETIEELEGSSANLRRHADDLGYLITSSS